jgi:hypothetical protein
LIGDNVYASSDVDVPESNVESNSERKNIIRICMYIAFLVGAAGVQEVGEDIPAPETLKSHGGSLAPRNLA